jgi:type IV pilus assembly protein PilF
MRALTLVALLAGSLPFVLVLPGCATNPTQQSEEAPSVQSGTITGEASDPRNRARIHTELASLYYGRGNMAVALEELRVAQEADGNYATVYGMYGLVYMGLRENARAQESFERALRLAPTDPDINHNYGWFLCQTGHEADSIKYFLQAIRNPLYATPWRSYSAAGQCSLRRNDLKEAEDLFDRALKLEPDDPPSLLQMGVIRYRQGRMDEARRLVARYNKLVQPTSESLWLALRVERKLGDAVAEGSYATQLRRRFPGSPEYQALQRGEFD